MYSPTYSNLAQTHTYANRLPRAPPQHQPRRRFDRQGHGGDEDASLRPGPDGREPAVYPGAVAVCILGLGSGSSIYYYCTHTPISDSRFPPPIKQNPQCAVERRTGKVQLTLVWNAPGRKEAGAELSRLLKALKAADPGNVRVVIPCRFHGREQPRPAPGAAVQIQTYMYILKKIK